MQVIGLKAVKPVKLLDLSGEARKTNRFIEHMRFTVENETGKTVHECETQEKTCQTTKKTWYEPMAASSQAGTETCIFRTVQSKQCERQDQIYRRIKTNSRKKDGLKVSS